MTTHHNTRPLGRFSCCNNSDISSNINKDINSNIKADFLDNVMYCKL